MSKLSLLLLRMSQSDLKKEKKKKKSKIKNAEEENLQLSNNESLKLLEGTSSRLEYEAPSNSSLSSPKVSDRMKITSSGHSPKGSDIIKNLSSGHSSKGSDIMKNTSSGHSPKGSDLMKNISSGHSSNVNEFMITNSDQARKHSLLDNYMQRSNTHENEDKVSSIEDHNGLMYPDTGSSLEESTVVENKITSSRSKMAMLDNRTQQKRRSSESHTRLNSLDETFAVTKRGSSIQEKIQFLEESGFPKINVSDSEHKITLLLDDGSSPTRRAESIQQKIDALVESTLARRRLTVGEMNLEFTNDRPPAMKVESIDTQHSMEDNTTLQMITEEVTDVQVGDIVQDENTENFLAEFKGKMRKSFKRMVEQGSQPLGQISHSVTAVKSRSESRESSSSTDSEELSKPHSRDELIQQVPSSFENNLVTDRKSMGMSESHDSLSNNGSQELINNHSRDKLMQDIVSKDKLIQDIVSNYENSVMNLDKERTTLQTLSEIKEILEKIESSSKVNLIKQITSSSVEIQTIKSGMTSPHLESKIKSELVDTVGVVYTSPLIELKSNVASYQHDINDKKSKLKEVEKKLHFVKTEAKETQILKNNLVNCNKFYCVQPETLNSGEKKSCLLNLHNINGQQKLCEVNCFTKGEIQNKQFKDCNCQTEISSKTAHKQYMHYEEMKNKDFIVGLNEINYVGCGRPTLTYPMICSCHVKNAQAEECNYRDNRLVTNCGNTCHIPSHFYNIDAENRLHTGPNLNNEFHDIQNDYNNDMTSVTKGQIMDRRTSKGVQDDPIGQTSDVLRPNNEFTQTDKGSINAITSKSVAKSHISDYRKIMSGKMCDAHHRGQTIRNPNCEFRQFDKSYIRGTQSMHPTPTSYGIFMHTNQNIDLRAGKGVMNDSNRIMSNVYDRSQTSRYPNNEFHKIDNSQRSSVTNSQIADIRHGMYGQNDRSDPSSDVHHRGPISFNPNNELCEIDSCHAMYPITKNQTTDHRHGIYGQNGPTSKITDDMFRNQEALTTQYSYYTAEDCNQMTYCCTDGVCQMAYEQVDYGGQLHNYTGTNIDHMKYLNNVRQDYPGSNVSQMSYADNASQLSYGTLDANVRQAAHSALDNSYAVPNMNYSDVHAFNVDYTGHENVDSGEIDTDTKNKLHFQSNITDADDLKFCEDEGVKTWELDNVYLHAKGAMENVQIFAEGQVENIKVYAEGQLSNIHMYANGDLDKVEAFTEGDLESVMTYDDGTEQLEFNLIEKTEETSQQMSNKAGGGNVFTSTENLSDKAAATNQSAYSQSENGYQSLGETNFYVKSDKGRINQFTPADAYNNDQAYFGENFSYNRDNSGDRSIVSPEDHNRERNYQQREYSSSSMPETKLSPVNTSQQESVAYPMYLSMVHPEYMTHHEFNSSAAQLVHLPAVFNRRIVNLSPDRKSRAISKILCNRNVISSNYEAHHGTTYVKEDDKQEKIGGKNLNVHTERAVKPASKLVYVDDKCRKPISVNDDRKSERNKGSKSLFGKREKKFAYFRRKSLANLTNPASEKPSFVYDDERFENETMPLAQQHIHQFTENNVSVQGYETDQQRSDVMECENKQINYHGQMCRGCRIDQADNVQSIIENDLGNNFQKSDETVCSDEKIPAREGDGYIGYENKYASHNEYNALAYMDETFDAAFKEAKDRCVDFAWESSAVPDAYYANELEAAAQFAFNEAYKTGFEDMQLRREIEHHMTEHYSSVVVNGVSMRTNNTSNLNYPSKNLMHTNNTLTLSYPSENLMHTNNTLTLSYPGENIMHTNNTSTLSYPNENIMHTNNTSTLSYPNENTIHTEKSFINGNIFSKHDHGLVDSMKEDTYNEMPIDRSRHKQDKLRLTRQSRLKKKIGIARAYKINSLKMNTPSRNASKILNLSSNMKESADYTGEVREDLQRDPICSPSEHNRFVIRVKVSQLSSAPHEDKAMENWPAGASRLSCLLKQSTSEETVDLSCGACLHKETKLKDSHMLARDDKINLHNQGTPLPLSDSVWKLDPQPAIRETEGHLNESNTNYLEANSNVECINNPGPTPILGLTNVQCEDLFHQDETRWLKSNRNVEIHQLHRLTNYDQPPNQLNYIHSAEPSQPDPTYVKSVHQIPSSTSQTLIIRPEDAQLYRDIPTPQTPSITNYTNVVSPLLHNPDNWTYESTSRIVNYVESVPTHPTYLKYQPYPYSVEQHPIQQQSPTQQHPIQQQSSTQQHPIKQQPPVQHHSIQKHPIQQHIPPHLIQQQPLQQPLIQQHLIQQQTVQQHPIVVDVRQYESCENMDQTNTELFPDTSMYSMSTKSVHHLQQNVGESFDPEFGSAQNYGHQAGASMPPNEVNLMLAAKTYQHTQPNKRDSFLQPKLHDYKRLEDKTPGPSSSQANKLTRSCRQCTAYKNFVKSCILNKSCQSDLNSINMSETAVDVSQEEDKTKSQKATNCGCSRDCPIKSSTGSMRSMKKDFNGDVKSDFCDCLGKNNVSNTRSEVSTDVGDLLAKDGTEKSETQDFSCDVQKDLKDVQSCGSDETISSSGKKYDQKYDVSSRSLSVSHPRSRSVTLSRTKSLHRHSEYKAQRPCVKCNVSRTLSTRNCSECVSDYCQRKRGNMKKRCTDAGQYVKEDMIAACCRRPMKSQQCQSLTDYASETDSDECRDSSWVPQSRSDDIDDCFCCTEEKTTASDISADDDDEVLNNSELANKRCARCQCTMSTGQYSGEERSLYSPEITDGQRRRNKEWKNDLIDIDSDLQKEANSGRFVSESLKFSKRNSPVRSQSQKFKCSSGICYFSKKADSENNLDSESLPCRRCKSPNVDRSRHVNEVYSMREKIQECYKSGCTFRKEPLSCRRCSSPTIDDSRIMEGTSSLREYNPESYRSPDRQLHFKVSERYRDKTPYGQNPL